MKKDLIFAPLMILIGVLLFLLKVTTLPGHIAIAVAGVLVLGVYTFATRKQWKIPALEILMRAFYGIALITGIVVMNVKDVAPLVIGHKVCSGLFLLLLVILFITKLIAKKEK